MARCRQSSERLINLRRNGLSRLTVPTTSQIRYCLPSSQAHLRRLEPAISITTTA